MDGWTETHTRAMDNHVDVLREVIERSDGTEIACDDHLQQILESRPSLQEILSLGFGSRSYHYRDPAFEQEIDDVST